MCSCDTATQAQRKSSESQGKLASLQEQLSQAEAEVAETQAAMKQAEAEAAALHKKARTPCGDAMPVRRWPLEMPGVLRCCAHRGLFVLEDSSSHTYSVLYVKGIDCCKTHAEHPSA